MRSSALRGLGPHITLWNKFGIRLAQHEHEQEPVTSAKQIMEQGRSLKQEFEHASSLAASLKSFNGRPDSPDYQAIVAASLKSFNRCKEFVYKLSLYSDNEGREDIATNDIKYLSVEYHMGQLTEKSQRLARLDTIKLAIDYYFKFLKDLRNYQLLDKVLSKRIQDTISTGKITLRDIKPTDPSTLRAEKIERFKKTKELEQRIESLKSSTDDEVVRDLQFAQLEELALAAVASLEMLNMELDIVAQFPDPINKKEHQEMEADDKRSEKREFKDSFTEKLESRLTNKDIPLLGKNGKVNRPFTIVGSKREQLQRKVMGTGQYFPTMSVEEYLDEEMKRGGIIQGGGPSSKKDDEDSESESDEEKRDAETYKAREWDEFVEANPKGSGNTINRG